MLERGRYAHTPVQRKEAIIQLKNRLYLKYPNGLVQEEHYEEIANAGLDASD